MNETDPGIFNSVEEWQQYLIDFHTMQEQSGQLAVAEETEVVPVEPTEPQTAAQEIQNSERFIDYPNRRKSLRGINSNGQTVYAKTTIAKKLYRCSCCPNAIDIGSEHVFTWIVQQLQEHSHHHTHNSCFHERLIDTLDNLKAIDVKETSPQKLTQKSRNLRARQSRHRRGVA